MTAVGGRRSGASLVSPLRSRAQAPQLRAVTHIASVSRRVRFEGIVQDEKGVPVAGAMVSALGATTAFAVTDRIGRFEIRSLSPGPYLVRAHLTGFVAPSRPGRSTSAPSGRSSSSIALRHASSVTSGVVVSGARGRRRRSNGAASETEGTTGAVVPPDTTPDTAKTPTDDHSEIAWRLRHARRGDPEGRRDSRRSLRRGSGG